MENLAALPKHEEQTLRVDCIKPFENIALAFSGGGFRAASFALGVLSYLHSIKFSADEAPTRRNSLLQQVTYMSSASGGTIATTLYALYNAQGKDFEAFYVKLFNSLTGEFLLQNALQILSDNKRWLKRPGKSRNMINAFAMAYDEYIFDGETLQTLFYGEIKGHLQEVCFNTTEFYTGLSFRQDMKMIVDVKQTADHYYKYGNENIRISHNTAAKIKLGDILAASSCFPAGFEPIVFPYDFTYQGLHENDSLAEATLKNALVLTPQTGDVPEGKFISKQTVGFMDGGIADNQGLQSMMYADGRRIRKETAFSPFDLMLVNDVASYFIKPYDNPPKATGGGINLNFINLLMLVFLLMATGFIAAGLYCERTVLALIGGLLFTVPAVFWYAYFKLMQLIKGGGEHPSVFRKNFTINIISLLVRYFKKAPVTALKQMLKARADSVLLLNLSVFLKRIRQLLYNKFYGSTEWKNRGKGNHIYDLAFSSDIFREKNPPANPFLNPSRDIQIVAETAFAVGTTLWFDNSSVKQQHSEGCIIACGQFTTCYNLLDYIEKLLADKTASIDNNPIYLSRLSEIKAQLEADYAKFKDGPFFMYNHDGLAYKIENFVKLDVKDIPFPENWEA